MLTKSLTRSMEMLFLIPDKLPSLEIGCFFEYLRLRKSQFKRDNSEMQARSSCKSIRTLFNVYFNPNSNSNLIQDF